jgi:group II intron reverse transcriptase/maturase
MQNPKVVLSNLANKTNENYKHTRIYRQLFNKDFYLLAYGNIYHKEGNMTVGTDGETIDGFSIDKVEKLIETLKDYSYQPNPARRTEIPKKDGSKRPLGIPSFQDKLLQEVIRMILESIYENHFSNNSHGFRPNRSTHTALKQVEKNFHGVRWFVEGDIKSFFDNIDHHILVSLLRKRIQDERFIDLIWKFLKAGYMKDWKYFNTYSGTPQGGTVSPILSNIYLNELDKFMKEYQTNFNQGQKRTRNKEYRAIEWKKQTLKKKIKTLENESPEREQLIKDYKKLSAEMREHSPYDEMDPNFKRLSYVRYADDCVIGINGSKEDALKVKQDIKQWLESTLKVELSVEKTLITHSEKPASFLGYEISIRRDEAFKKISNGMTKRVWSYTVNLKMPTNVVRDKLLHLKAIQVKGNQWEFIHRKELTNLDDLEIFNIYNAEIRGLYNYYKLASNVPMQMDTFHHMMKYSLLKTLASKYKITVKQVISKFAIGKDIAVKYQTKKGERTSLFYNKGFKRVRELESKNLVVDSLPSNTYGTRTSLIERLNAEQCEHCGIKGKVEVHHVRKLKNLKGKKRWEKLMIARKRKTLVLCERCHDDLHAGRLD